MKRVVILCMSLVLIAGYTFSESLPFIGSWDVYKYDNSENSKETLFCMTFEQNGALKIEYPDKHLVATKWEKVDKENEYYWLSFPEMQDGKIFFGLFEKGYAVPDFFLVGARIREMKNRQGLFIPGIGNTTSEHFELMPIRKNSSPQKGERKRRTIEEKDVYTADVEGLIEIPSIKKPFKIKLKETQIILFRTIRQGDHIIKNKTPSRSIYFNIYDAEDDSEVPLAENSHENNLASQIKLELNGQHYYLMGVANIHNEDINKTVEIEISD